MSGIMEDTLPNLEQVFQQMQNTLNQLAFQNYALNQQILNHNSAIQSLQSSHSTVNPSPYKVKINKPKEFHGLRWSIFFLSPMPSSFFNRSDYICWWSIENQLYGVILTWRCFQMVRCSRLPPRTYLLRSRGIRGTVQGDFWGRFIYVTRHSFCGSSKVYTN